MRTELDALAAAYTFIREIHELGDGGLRLRIGAPYAPQGAAFDKDIGADTRSIMDAIVLDVEDGTSYGSKRVRHIGHSFPSWGSETHRRLPRLILA